MRLKNIIHEGLKCRICIREAKGHYQELKMPMMGSKSHLMYVDWVHANLEIACYKVNFAPCHSLIVH